MRLCCAQLAHKVPLLGLTFVCNGKGGGRVCFVLADPAEVCAFCFDGVVTKIVCIVGIEHHVLNQTGSRQMAVLAFLPFFGTKAIHVRKGSRSFGKFTFVYKHTQRL